MAKKRMAAKRSKGMKKTTGKPKSRVRTKAKPVPRGRAKSRKPGPAPAVKRSSPKAPRRTAAKSTVSTAKPTLSVPIDRGAPAALEPKPGAFWDPKSEHSTFTGDPKAHTKPEDQRSHIRMQAPRTWSNRQPGRG
jgi:hypothetical protein